MEALWSSRENLPLLIACLFGSAAMVGFVAAVFMNEFCPIRYDDFPEDDPPPATEADAGYDEFFDEENDDQLVSAADAADEEETLRNMP